MPTIDRHAALALDAYIFPKNEWEFREPDASIPGETVPQLASYVPGTWCPIQSWMNRDIVAIVSCPKCKQIRFLVRGIHTLDAVGKVTPDFKCNLYGCDFHRPVYLDRWSKKPLYACAIERFNPFTKKYVPEVLYTHATNQREAEFQIGYGDYKIVAVAPAIGFFTADAEGKDESKLITDVVGRGEKGGFPGAAKLDRPLVREEK